MIKKTARLIIRLTSFVISSFLLVAVTLILASAISARKGVDLDWWHNEKIDSEFRASDSDTINTLGQYLAREALVFAELEALVERNSPRIDSPFLNRFQKGNDSYPEKPGQNFNRSAVKQPAVIKGGVLLLHGMTDSPYSLRHFATMFEENGFYVLNMRMPGHGTLPSELDRMQWQDWLAAAKIGARHVAAQLHSDQPFYVLGYSNGGSLALKYSMDSLADSEFRTPDRLFLLSPMIAVDSLARFSRLFYWLSRLEYFRHSRWLDIYPEYDPHKYNSFPMNAGLQSYKLTTTIRDQISRMASSGNLDRMPPVLTFQSLVDSTVITSAVLDDLYEKLPANGSELVLFDVNHVGELEEYILPKHKALLSRAMNEGSGRYAVSVITNRAENDPIIVELRQVDGMPGFKSRSLQYAWPEDVYSLTHVALPFPLDDTVYGLEHSRGNSEYPHFGRIQLLGESGALILPPALLQRLRSNPFYGYIEARVAESAFAGHD
jgi:alpha-beta hydrolase superfamily lysophospholipase